MLPGSSQIQQFIAGKNIFVTGGTGFLGRLLIEKLLRSCPEVGKIYMLVRPKRNKTPEKRLEEYFQEPIYDPLKKTNPGALNKVKLAVGDCSLQGLGLDDNNKNLITSQVNCIFHCAATMKFDENLKTAAEINVRATRDLIDLAKKATNLNAFVHVSTAYSFCPLNTIEERNYEPGIKADSLLKFIDIVDKRKIDNMQKAIIDEWPNTYTFTKATAEEFVYREGRNLPLAIVRPSMVAATFEEPIQGWINNFYGPTGVFTAFELGVIRVDFIENKFGCDLVPADFVVNSIIASAWEVGANTSKTSNPKHEVPIFNVCMSKENSLPVPEMLEMFGKHSEDIPSTRQVWHKVYLKPTNHMAESLLWFLLQTLPMRILGSLSYVLRKKLTYVEQYEKVHNFVKTVKYFLKRKWCFKTDKTISLFDKMSPNDKKLFNFDMRTFNWDVFFRRYAYGTRKYLLKESIDTVPEGVKRRFNLKIAHYALATLLGLIFSSNIYTLILLFT